MQRVGGWWKAHMSTGCEKDPEAARRNWLFVPGVELAGCPRDRATGASLRLPAEAAFVRRRRMKVVPRGPGIFHEILPLFVLPNRKKVGG